MSERNIISAFEDKIDCILSRNFDVESPFL